MSRREKNEMKPRGASRRSEDETPPREQGSAATDADVAQDRPDAPRTDRFEPRSRALRIVFVALAILLPQIALFWPSLTGEKALLPLDVLATRSIWIAPGEPEHLEASSDDMLSDLVFVTELNRRYTAEAVRAGRFPTWVPDTYCGAPYFASNHPAVFSPYRLVDYAWPGVEAIAWSQLVKALVAGLGTYLFARRVLRSTYFAALVGAAAFPLCGYMILWQGFSLSQVASWLPWTLWAADSAARRPFGAGALWLALATCVLMVSGHAANAGHVLVASGMWAAWVAYDVQGRGAGERAWRGVFRALGSVACGWLLGFALSAPQLVPTVEYMQQSVRIAARAAGEVETPAMGPVALWQLALPYALGSSERGALMLVTTPRSESGAAAYAGLLALGFLAPLAFSDPTRRRAAFVLLACGAFALVPLLGVPLFELVFTWPPFSLLRNNRFTIVTAFSIVVLAVVGLDALVRGRVRARAWGHWIPSLVCAALASWCLVRLVDPPVVPEAQVEFAWFRATARVGLVVALTAVAAWIVLRRIGVARQPQLALAAGIALIAELTLQSAGANPQCDRRYDYPRLAVLDEIARLDPSRSGRVLGLNSLPPNVLRAQGLWDVRGYDAADPVRIVELLRAQRDPEAPPEYSYAVTLTHVPKHPSPISDLLALRWIVIPGSPPPGVQVAFTGGGYSLFENTAALPRATIPARVEVVADKAQRLARLGAAEFDPRATAIVEQRPAIELPERAVGQVRIEVDEPERVVLRLELETDALVRLADSYDAGWKAWVDGQPSEVLVVDHALRGVVAPKGARVLEFRYEPSSFVVGLWIGGAALVSMCAWAFALRRRRAPRAVT